MTNVTASYTVLPNATSQNIDCYTTNMNLVITMPPAGFYQGTPMKGVQYYITKKTHDVNSITIQDVNNNTIITFTAPNFKVSVISDGTNWNIYPMSAAYPMKRAGDGSITNPRFGRYGTV